MFTALSEMPGGKSVDDGKGVAESPAGMFAGSSFISRLDGLFELELAFDNPLDPHALKARTKLTKTERLFNISF
jgi:hypothetical protein